MTLEEALRFIDPETDMDALAEIEYYNGFKGKDAAAKALHEASQMVVDFVRQMSWHDAKNPPIAHEESWECAGEKHCAVISDIVWVCCESGHTMKGWMLAGVMFGVYMVLAALLTWVNFSPLLNTLKAILITIIALSSLSTYLYSEYLVFGENIGFLIDVLTVTSWQLVIPLGVMGIWTLMSELRVYIIIFVLLASVVLHLVSDRKEDAR